MEDALTILLAVGFLLIADAVLLEAAPNICPVSLPDQSLLRVYNGACYEFVDLERYWNVAQDDCISKGGNLIKIADPETQAFVMAALKDLNWDRNGVWIGAHDKTTEGAWQWITGETVTWSNWDDGQPSCYLPQLRVFCAEDCATLRLSDGGKWHDKRCNTPGFSYTYICEYRLLPTPAPTTIGNETTEPAIITQSNVSQATNLTPDGQNTGNHTEWGESSTFPETTISLTTVDEIIVTIEQNCSAQTEASCGHTTVDDQSIVRAVTTTDKAEEKSTDLPDYMEVETKSPALKTVDDQSIVRAVTTTDKAEEKSTDLPDYMEVETMLPVLETTHIVIDKYGDGNTSDDYEYEYHALPEMIAAQTKGDDQMETKQSATGPVVGALLGLCLLAAVLVSAYYLHRKRGKNKNEEWTVGFDNPNYGGQDQGTLPFTADLTENERFVAESQTVNVFPPEDSDPVNMRGAWSAPEACCSSPSSQSAKGNDYVFHDFSNRKM